MESDAGIKNENWTKYVDFDDLSRDLTAGDFNSNLIENRFSSINASNLKTERAVKVPQNAQLS